MDDPAQEMMIAFDVLSGEVVLALHGHPIFLADIDAYVRFLDVLYSVVPKLRAGQEAAMGCANRSAPIRPIFEFQNWSVVVQERHSDIDHDEQIERIAAATGWSSSRTRREFRKGFPMILGSGLTLVDALNLQEAAELNGVTANITASQT